MPTGPFNLDMPTIKLPELFVYGQMPRDTFPTFTIPELPGMLLLKDLPKETPLERALRESRLRTVPITDFSNARDLNWLQKLWVNNFTWLSDPSTCTVSGTSLYGDKYTYAGNEKLIYEAGHNGYKLANSINEIQPGEFIVLTSGKRQGRNNKGVPEHLTVFNGYAQEDGVYVNSDGTRIPYKKGEPMVNYSNGGRSTNPEDHNYKVNVPLSIFQYPEYKAKHDLSGEPYYVQFVGGLKFGGRLIPRRRLFI